MSVNIVILESTDRQLAANARGAGLVVSAALAADQLPSIERMNRPPDVLFIDVRDRPGLPPGLAALKRRMPTMGVVIVAAALDPALMLEAMRAGVTEFVTEPVTPDELREAVDRVLGYHAAPAAHGQVHAFVGAKGGVGTTTLAVNVAAALAARKDANVLMADLHVAVHGDAGLLLGVEPRFSVVEAIENISRLDRAYLSGIVQRTKAGLDVLASLERPSLRPPDPDQVRGLLDRIAAAYKIVVLDVPRTDMGVLDALEPITNITLVVNQELPTIRRAAQIASLLRQRYGKDKVAAVVSRYDARADIGQEDIQRVVGLPVWGVFPSDYRKVLLAANAGRPLVSEDSRLASAITQFALKLASVDEVKRTARPAGRLGGLF